MKAGRVRVCVDASFVSIQPCDSKSKIKHRLGSMWGLWVIFYGICLSGRRAECVIRYVQQYKIQKYHKLLYFFSLLCLFTEILLYCKLKSIRLLREYALINSHELFENGILVYLLSSCNFK